MYPPSAILDEDRHGHPDDTLMIQRCTRCRKLLAPLIVTCSSCARGDSLEWLPSSGAGSIVSWRVVDRSLTAMDNVRPLTIAIVELDEGPWVYTSIEGEVPPQRDRVRVQFQPRPMEDRFPVFAVSAESRNTEEQRMPADLIGARME
ncbi:hypothetical protein GV794_14925 [Nocardia cyriacigeorgica]|uniref:ChsH2 C-terminal OB-fold domain-containing protein n=1 Tax=Nocardia cyriacigeorgica TaxID=135487 RepID=A0A6P1D3V1_9NOCA|nr:OB-fold domain-containing protein [Nocardia cyriacigeorgica]NEW42230.1 hypothetical protein [Nocardia cyriacigeorgica]NEW44209.1 hypothetical protein [Nocardia cyriacigeorgica]NEW51294.1 hypothetical protein [Nocardia cyriacigeorgica]NEW56939.1 hypothetical protein [Nocardia cyriacigeorgica]